MNRYNNVGTVYKCNIYVFNVCATYIYVPAIRGRDCIRNDPKEFSDSCSRTTSVCPWHRPSWTSGGRRSSTSSTAAAAAHPPSPTDHPSYFTHTDIRNIHITIIYILLHTNREVPPPTTTPHTIMSKTRHYIGTNVYAAHEGSIIFGEEKT